MEGAAATLLGVVVGALLSSGASALERLSARRGAQRDEVTGALRTLHDASWRLFVYLVRPGATPRGVMEDHVAVLSAHLHAEALLRRSAGPDRRTRALAAEVLSDLSARLRTTANAWEASSTPQALHALRAVVTVMTAVGPRWVRDPASFATFDVEQQVRDLDDVLDAGPQAGLTARLARRWGRGGGSAWGRWRR